MALSLHTEICDMLGIEYPIFAFNHCQDVTAAVSNGGGLGVFGLAELDDIDEMRAAVNWIRNHTDKPFGLDFLLPEAPPAAPQSSTRQALPPQVPRRDVDFTDRLRKELGLPDNYGREEPDTRSPNVTTPAPRGRAPTQMELVDLVCEAKPTIFAGGLGMNKEAVEKCHAAGIKVVSLVGRMRHVQRVLPMGVDIIVAQGHEAGGHTGRIGTMPLVPLVVDAAKPVPVLAAGGIADGRGLVAALALGAVGAWTGSLWLTAHEHPLADFLKERILAGSEDDTIISRCWSGKTMRHLRNKYTEFWEQADEPNKPVGGRALPGLTMIAAETTDPRVEKYGLQDWITTPCGQTMGLLTQRRPARQILHDMVSQAIDILAD